MEGEKLYNLTKLDAIASGNQDFIQNMVNLFIVETPKEMDNIRKCLEENDYKSISSIAHKVKPSVDYVCEPHLFLLIKEVELWESSDEVMVEKIQRLLDSMEIVVDQLKEL